MAHTMRYNPQIVIAAQHVDHTRNVHVPESVRASGSVCTCKHCRGTATRSGNYDATGKFVAAFGEYLTASRMYETSRNNSTQREIATAMILKAQTKMKINEGNGNFDRAAAQRACEEMVRSNRDANKHDGGTHIMKT